MLLVFSYMALLAISKAYVNVALNKPAYQQYPVIPGDDRYDASNAVDGRKSDLSFGGGQCAVSWYEQTATWWVNLTRIHSIHHITIYFMTNNDGWRYLARYFLGFSVYVSNTTDRSQGTLCFKDNNFTKNTIPPVFTTNCFVHGQYVIYYNERLPGVVYPDDYRNYVWSNLCEVEVYGCPVTGFYGSNCSTPCPDVNCQYCHIETGYSQCCKPGYQGHHCELACNKGFFGVNCSEKCGQCRKIYQCHHIYGTCLTGCAAGYQGGMCKTGCGKGSYGLQCKETCGHCRDINQCSNVNGSCLTGCDAGFNGELCKTRCDKGAYGFDCKETCGNCREIGQCFPTNGTCLTGCDDGYQGDLCNTQCDRGSYGSECNETCGHCCDVSQCSNVNGTCLTGCDAGFKGDLCKTQCDRGSYGIGCNETCGRCLDVSQCSHINGTCLTGCEAGFKGHVCKTDCDSGSYGVHCNEICGNCLNESQCSNINGTCFTGCNAGYEGDLCKTQCNRGSYGYGCNETCGHCRNKSYCFPINGTCLTGCDVGYEGALCKTPVTTDTGIDTRALGSSQNELSIIKLAFALTVPGMFILCLGVNFLCYKWGVKKGRSSYKKQAKSPGETQALDYHLYDDETPLSQLRSGPSGGPAVDPATHDYAAYDEIKEQRQRIAAGSERKKDGGYITPMAQDRPLPPVSSGDGNGYISPKTAQKQPQKGNAGKNGDSPSPPGNGGYLSPLEERKLSSNSDSGSDKSDKSRKYQNEPGKKSPKSKGVYESIKDAGITQEHQYIDLHTTVS